MRCWWSAIVALIFAGMPLPTQANPMTRYRDATEGSFSNPVLSGYKIDVSGRFFFQDNTSTAIYSGFGTNAIQWGGRSTFPISYSSLSFVGNAFDVAAGEEFDLGRITFTNGTSSSDSSIFAAVLTISAPSIFPRVDPLLLSMDLLTTTNGNVDPRRDADIVQFREAGVLFPLAFSVLEGATATAILRGRILGDPYITLTNVIIDAGSTESAFLSPSLAIPEPATWLLVVGGFAVLAATGRRASVAGGHTRS